MNFKNLIITGLAALAMTSCSKNEEVVNEVENGEEAVVSFKLSCDDNFNTKATGRHILYSLNDNNVKSAKDNGEIEEELKINKSYTFNFWWVENGDPEKFDGVYTTDLTNEDLFCGTYNFIFTSQNEIYLGLTRPYAKIRITAPKESVITDSTKIEIEGLGTKYDISTEKVVEIGTISKTCKFENGVVAEAFGFIDSSIKNVKVIFTVNDKTITKILGVGINTITNLDISNVNSSSPIIKISNFKDWNDTNIDYILNDYEISNLEELKEFRNAVNAGADYSGRTIKLTNDIDLENELWEPMSCGSITFDGQGHTIKNLNIVNEESYYTGFFKTIGNVYNLTIENATVKGNSYVGILAGRSYNDSYLENITIKGDIKIEGKDKNIGGFFGLADGTTFKNLILDANPGSYINGWIATNVGGFAGELEGNSSNIVLKDNSIKIKNIEIRPSKYSSVGGFIGSIDNNTIIYTNKNFYLYNCELENVVISNYDYSKAGNFIGYCDNSYNDYYFYNCKITENGETRIININDFGAIKSEDGGQLFFYD